MIDGKKTCNMVPHAKFVDSVANATVNKQKGTVNS